MAPPSSSRFPPVQTPLVPSDSSPASTEAASPDTITLVVRDQLKLLLAPLTECIRYLEAVVQNLTTSVGDDLHTLTQNQQGIYNKLFDLADSLPKPPPTPSSPNQNTTQESNAPSTPQPMLLFNGPMTSRFHPLCPTIPMHLLNPRNSPPSTSVSPTDLPLRTYVPPSAGWGSILIKFSTSTIQGSTP